MCYIYVILDAAFIFILFFPFRKKLLETKIKFNFIDYKDINFYDEIRLEYQNRIIYKKDIKEKKLIAKIFENEKKKIINGIVKIRSSKNNAEKEFKLLFYTNHINDINIRINNSKSNYYNSEIIFYGDDIQKSVKLGNLFFNSFNLRKRIRLVICNFKKKQLTKIIKSNYRNKLFKEEFHEIINKNSGNTLLINIFISQENSNILIFQNEEQKLIIPDENERKLFEKFYNTINFKRIYQRCNLFEKKIFSKEKLFGISIISKTYKEKKEVYISFLNQGINCLLENNIITRKDKNFIFGYLILFVYLIYDRRIFAMKDINKIIKEMRAHKFYEIDQIKVIISYTIFCLNYNEAFYLKFTEDLKEDNHYYMGFKFYKSIIQDLDEESELMLIYL